jgi:hypothetical protein
LPVWTACTCGNEVGGVSAMLLARALFLLWLPRPLSLNCFRKSPFSSTA